MVSVGLVRWNAGSSCSEHALPEVWRAEMLGKIVEAYRAAFRGLPREVWLLSWVMLVNRVGSMVLPFLSLYLTRERGFSTMAAGGLLSLYGAGAIAGAWLGGWASDRIGPTRTQQWSLLGSGVALLALGFVRSLPGILIAVVVLSVVHEAFRPAVMADVARRTPAESRARAYALLRLAINVALGVGPAVGGFLALIGYQWLFLGDAVTCWLAAALLVLMLSPAADRRGGASDSGKAAAGSPWSDGPFLMLLLLVVCLGAVFFQVMSTMPLYLRDHFGLRENVIGILLAFNALLIVIFEMVLTYWAENRERMPLVGFGCFLVCVGLGLMPFGTSVAFAALTVVIWSAGEMLALPLINAAVADRAESGRGGSYMGLYMMAYSVAFVIAPVVGTFVYERFGADWLWYGVAALGIPLWVGALALRRFLTPDALSTA